jgi:hypothetical protein
MSGKLAPSHAGNSLLTCERYTRWFQDHHPSLSLNVLSQIKMITVSRALTSFLLPAQGASSRRRSSPNTRRVETATDDEHVRLTIGPQRQRMAEPAYRSK